MFIILNLLMCVCVCSAALRRRAAGSTRFFPGPGGLRRSWHLLPRHAQGEVHHINSQGQIMGSIVF